MKREIITIVCALTLLVAAIPASAAVITTSWGIGPTDSVNLETNMFNKYRFYTTETYEGFSAGDPAGPGTYMNLAIGDQVGGGFVSDGTPAYTLGDERAINGSNYWSNGTPGKLAGKGMFSIIFDTPSQAAGFYATSFLDFGGSYYVGLGTLDGGQTIDLYNLVGDVDPLDQIYVAFESDVLLTGITFYPAGNEGFAIDDISTMNTPVPGAVWLLGTGLLGLIGYRRVRS